MTNLKLTDTQQQLLTVLRALRDASDATEVEANARAIGGLTAIERFERGAVFTRQRTYFARVGNKEIRVDNVTFGTFRALCNAGLVDWNNRGMVRAKEGV